MLTYMSLPASLPHTRRATLCFIDSPKPRGAKTRHVRPPVLIFLADEGGVVLAVLEGREGMWDGVGWDLGLKGRHVCLPFTFLFFSQCPPGLRGDEHLVSLEGGFFFRSS